MEATIRSVWILILLMKPNPLALSSKSIECSAGTNYRLKTELDERKTKFIYFFPLNHFILFSIQNRNHTIAAVGQ